ncbi:hypothetical protein BGY98DRAFT_966524 [Russula aff. rugulosa BPL654]|nr:hypothetical protein BGY98DRAFT_966524 [Russula aff. rugulosa BPL654]
MDATQSPRAGSSNALQRGKACLNCRFKCDGVRPVCGPCSRANRPDDCEYTDGQNRTRTQMLEDTIAQLETRIHELEHPNSTPSSVMLHDPHSTFYQTQQTSISGTSELSPSLIIPSTGFSQSSHSPASSTPSIGSAVSTPLSSTSVTWTTSDEPPAHIAQELRPIPALINVVYLWGILIIKNNDLRHHEPILASRVASQLGSAISTTPSHQILQVIQAKILLVDYLFSIGHFAAALHEAHSASSLAVASGLHKIRTAQPIPAHTSFIDRIDLTLQEPRDQIEEGERINAFWAVFFMDRCLSVMFGPPLVISDMDAPGMQIDTPWPLEMETYERGQIYPNMRTSGTVRSFFSGINNGWPWENHNPLTQLSKAAALFERAARLAATWRPEIQNIGSFYSDFVAADQRIDEFKRQLTPIDRVSSQNVPLLHLAYCLCNGATIQLHATFSSQNTGSRAKCLSAAMAIVRANQAAQVQEYVFTSAILGSLWAASGRVIVSEIVARRCIVAEPTTSPEQRDGELRGGLEQIQSVMAVPALRCGLMNYYLGRLQQECAGI